MKEEGGGVWRAYKLQLNRLEYRPEMAQEREMDGPGMTGMNIERGAVVWMAVDPSGIPDFQHKAKTLVHSTLPPRSPSTAKKKE